MRPFLIFLSRCIDRIPRSYTYIQLYVLHNNRIVSDHYKDTLETTGWFVEMSGNNTCFHIHAMMSGRSILPSFQLMILVWSVIFIFQVPPPPKFSKQFVFLHWRHSLKNSSLTNISSYQENFDSSPFFAPISKIRHQPFRFSFTVPFFETT